MKRFSGRLVAALSVVFALSCGGKATPAQETTPAAASNEGALVAGESGGAPAAEPVAPSIALPEIPATPAMAPAELMAEFSLSNPNAQLTSFGVFADAVQPGTGAFITPQLFMQGLAGAVGVQQLNGVDLNSPMHLLVLSGEQAVVVVSIQDENALRDSIKGSGLEVIAHGSYAAVGRIEALATAAPYALSNLVTQALSPDPLLTAHVGNLFAGPEGAQLLAIIGAEIGNDPAAQAGAALAVDLLHQMDLVKASLATNADAASLQLQVTAKGPGTLQDFISKQRPSSYEMVEHIGTGPWAFAMAGRLDLSMMSPMLETLLNKEPAAAIFKGAILSMLNSPSEMGLMMNLHKTPEFVLAMNLVNNQEVPNTINALIEMMKADKNLSMKDFAVKIKTNSIKTRGGSLHELKMSPRKDLDKVAKKELEDKFGKRGVSAFVGVATNRLITTFGPSAKNYAKTLTVASAKGKGKGTELAKVVSASKAAGESFLISMDPVSLNAEKPTSDVAPVSMGIGFGGGAYLGVRIHVPTSFVKEAAKAGF